MYTGLYFCWQVMTLEKKFLVRYFLRTFQISSPPLNFFKKISDLSPPSLIKTPSFINFLVFFWGKQHFCYEIRNFKEAASGGVHKKILKIKRKTPVFSIVFISFQHSIYQVISLNLRNLFSHSSSTLFSLSINCNFVHTQANFHTFHVIRIKINKKASPHLFQFTCLLYFTIVTRKNI